MRIMKKELNRVLLQIGKLNTCKTRQEKSILYNWSVRDDWFIHIWRLTMNILKLTQVWDSWASYFLSQQLKQTLILMKYFNNGVENRKEKNWNLL